MEDEIDLRKYVKVLLRQWKVIVSITLIAVIVAVLVSFLSPRTYEARASVLITTTRSEIILEPEYRTFPEQDKASLRDTLLALVKSGTVATKVIEQLGDKLDPEERRAGYLLDKVQASERDNLIEITVEFIDPYKAAAIANTWVESYESYVNGLYSEISQSPAGLQVQADAAREEYLEKQKVWEDFISDNRINELSRQIADMELLCNVKSLREQIEAGSSSPAAAAANTLALILLQTEAFTRPPAELQTGALSGSPAELQTETLNRPPAELQVSLDQLSGLDISLDDVDTLIATLEARSGDTPGQSIGQLRQQILQLRGELERERARQRDFENSRDIAWEAYATVAGKITEVKVAAMAQSALVQVAEVAIVPESPVAPRRVMNIGIALVLGLVLGIFGAFGFEYFKKPGEEPEVEKKKEQ